MGDSGAGKTYSITTLLEAGLKVFVIITEATGLDSLLDAITTKNLPIDNLHWKVIPPTTQNMSSILEQAQKVNTLDFEGLQRLKSGVSKRDCQQYITLLNTISNFTCDRTKNSYGDVTEWDDKRAFVLDSLSGLNEMVIQNTVGTRPTIQLQEYGIIQAQQRALINAISSTRAYFILTTHLDRLVDEMSGGLRIMALTVGKKLAPDLPKFFSEVVLAQREGTKFTWSTASSTTIVKNRALSVSDSLPPSFAPIIEAHERRKLQAKPSPTSPTSTKEDNTKERERVIHAR